MIILILAPKPLNIDYFNNSSWNNLVLPQKCSGTNYTILVFQKSFTYRTILLNMFVAPNSIVLTEYGYSLTIIFLISKIPIALKNVRMCQNQYFIINYLFSYKYI